MTNILLAEDHEELWGPLSRRLRRRNFEVVLARYGQQALDRMAAETPAFATDRGATKRGGLSSIVGTRLSRRLRWMAYEAVGSSADEQGSTRRGS